MGLIDDIEKDLKEKGCVVGSTKKDANFEKRYRNKLKKLKQNIKKAQEKRREIYKERMKE